MSIELVCFRRWGSDLAQKSHLESADTLPAPRIPSPLGGESGSWELPGDSPEGQGLSSSVPTLSDLARGQPDAGG